MITIEQIKELLREMAALSEAATPGPWIPYDNLSIHPANVERLGVTTDGYDIAWCNMLGREGAECSSNSAFIAKSRALTPAVCKALLLAIEGA